LFAASELRVRLAKQRETSDCIGPDARLVLEFRAGSFLMATDLIRYDLLVQDALRSVVRKVLADTARSGLPGEHHFNIAFKTHAPGVVIPAAIKQRFPEEMSIILQHEFWDLVVTQDAFEVSLNFSRKPERLCVPFDSITGFTDPSVPFGFKLEPRLGETAAISERVSTKDAVRTPPATESKPAAPGATPPKLAPPKPAPQPPAATKPAQRAEKPPADKPSERAGEAKGEAKVVSIDAFRKK
jgi:hypothetical protein